MIDYDAYYKKVDEEVAKDKEGPLFWGCEYCDVFMQSKKDITKHRKTCKKRKKLSKRAARNRRRAANVEYVDVIPDKTVS